MKIRLLLNSACLALGLSALASPAVATVGCFDGLHQVFHDALLKGKSLVNKLKHTHNPSDSDHTLDAPLREWVFHRYPQQSFNSLSSSLELQLTFTPADNLSDSQLCHFLTKQWGEQIREPFWKEADYGSEIHKFFPIQRKSNKRLIGHVALSELFDPIPCDQEKQKLQAKEAISKAQQLSDSQLRAALLKTWGSQLN